MAPNKTSSPRILIIRPSALGDVARTVPALTTLRRAYPQARLDWLVHESFADAIRHHPALDEVIPFSRKAMSGALLKPAATRAFFAFARQLRQAGYDEVYDLQGLGRSGLFTRLTRAKVRIGDQAARELGWLGYNRKYALPKKLHAVDHMLALLEAHGHEPVRDMKLYLSAQDQAFADDFCQTHQLTPGKYAAIAPTAQWGCKCWPVDRYQQIIRRLLKRDDLDDRVVILAAPHEQERIQPLLEAWGEQVIFPQTRVGQLMALIRHCAILVCNDSAPLHIAVGFDKPIACIFGPTDPALVGPYQREATIIQPQGITAAQMQNYRKQRDNAELIGQVTVDQVWQVVEQQLSKG